MRIPILLLGLCTACATPVYDLTAEEVRAKPDPAGAIVAETTKGSEPSSSFTERQRSMKIEQVVSVGQSSDASQRIAAVTSGRFGCRKHPGMRTNVARAAPRINTPPTS